MISYSRNQKNPIAGALAVKGESISFAYDRTDRWALRDVTIAVSPGARVGLMGPNGSGKSTLIMSIAGLLKPTHGEIQVLGWPAGSCRRSVSYLPQRTRIDWRFPVSLRQLVLAGRYAHFGWLKRPRSADLEIVARVLAEVGLDTLADRQIDALSGGQQQRALLARALAQEADLLLLDEPLNHVDAETSQAVILVLDELRAQGKTVIVSTHDPEEFETGFDDVLCLKDGQLVEGTGRTLQQLRELAWAR